MTTYPPRKVARVSNSNPFSTREREDDVDSGQVVRGPPGPKGDTGERGPRGPQGERGPTGPSGGSLESSLTLVSVTTTNDPGFTGTLLGDVTGDVTGNLTGTADKATGINTSTNGIVKTTDDNGTIDIVSGLAASEITSGTLAVARGGTNTATTGANNVFAGPTSGVDAAPSFRGLDSDDIPVLDAGKITTGTFTTDQIPDLSANKITSDTLDTARIPSLSASKITSGTLAVAQGGTNTATTGANNVFAGPTSGVDAAPSFRGLDSDDIPVLDAGKITSGTFATARIPNLDASKITTGNLALPSGSTIAINTSTVDQTELGYLEGASEGNAVASKALVVDASKDLTGIRYLNLANTGDAVGFESSTDSTFMKVRHQGTGVLLLDSSNDIRLRTGSSLTQAMRVFDGGNVHIGTDTAAPTCDLDVNQHVRAQAYTLFSESYGITTASNQLAIFNGRTAAQSSRGIGFHMTNPTENSGGLGTDFTNEVMRLTVNGDLWLKTGYIREGLLPIGASCCMQVANSFPSTTTTFNWAKTLSTNTAPDWGGNRILVFGDHADGNAPANFNMALNHVVGSHRLYNTNNTPGAIAPYNVIEVQTEDLPGKPYFKQLFMRLASTDYAGIYRFQFEIEMANTAGGSTNRNMFGIYVDSGGHTYLGKHRSEDYSRMVATEKVHLSLDFTVDLQNTNKFYIRTRCSEESTDSDLSLWDDADTHPAADTRIYYIRCTWTWVGVA